MAEAAKHFDEVTKYIGNFPGAMPCNLVITAAKQLLGVVPEKLFVQLDDASAGRDAGKKVAAGLLGYTLATDPSTAEEHKLRLFDPAIRIAPHLCEPKKLSIADTLLSMIARDVVGQQDLSRAFGYLAVVVKDRRDYAHLVGAYATNLIEARVIKPEIAPAVRRSTALLVPA